jgi:hypothetical protein
MMDPTSGDRLAINRWSGDQQMGLSNSTMSVAGETAVSIAVMLPDHMSDMSQDEIEASLREDFKHLTDIGYVVEAWVGPNDDEDYNDQGNLKPGCGHNEQ